MSELKLGPPRKRKWASLMGGRIECSDQCRQALLNELHSRRALQPRWTKILWLEEVGKIRALACWGVGEWGGLRARTADGKSCEAKASVGVVDGQGAQSSSSNSGGGASGFAALAEANPIQAIGLPAPTGMASGSNMWSTLSLARQQPLSLSQCRALFDDQYIIEDGVEELLVPGTFGVVFPGVARRSGDRVSAKFVQGPFHEIVQEVCILGNLRHRNVIQILDAYKVDRGAVFIMRHAGQTLSSLIGGGLSVPTSACHLRQIALGLSWIHSQLIIHADLKPANILVDAEGEAVIGDFGNAVIIGDSTRLGTTRDRETLRRQGVQEVTVCYRAPEVCLGEKAYGAEIDIWALGCIFSEMMTGRRTFQGCHEIEVFHQILMKLGHPRGESVLQYYRLLVNWQASFPSPSASEWTAEASLIPASSGGVLLLQGMLTWDPQLRICGANIASHSFCQAWGAKQTPMQLVVMDGGSDFQGNFGPYCIRKAVMPKELLAWSRETRCFQQPAQRSYNHGGDAEPVVEEVGLLTGHETLRLNGKNADKFLFDKLIAFKDALLEVNAASFSKLEQRLDAALQEIPPEDLGINGSKLLERKMTQWLWPFGTLQFAPNYPHECPEHNDGGLALILLAIGYYGWRVLRCFREDAEPFDLELAPGSVYIAPVSAFKHQVLHRGAPANSGGSPDLLHVPGLGLCKVTAIIRCRAFQEQWSTLRGRKPAPMAVFDVANNVVKEWLTHEPLCLPNLGQCERALQAIEGEASRRRDACHIRTSIHTTAVIYYCIVSFCYIRIQAVKYIRYYSDSYVTSI
jgi:serine/threonine protein kinase